MHLVLHAKKCNVEYSNHFYRSMKSISEHIALKFYEALNHKIDLTVFEQWVYHTKELETELSEETYLELVSLNYKSKHILSDLEKVIGAYIDNVTFDTKRIIEILHSIVNRDENCSQSIEVTYHLYCSGYTFLRRLGLTYGLMLKCLTLEREQRSWQDLSVQEQNSILDQFFPEIIFDAQNVVTWLQEGKIIIKGPVNAFGTYEYDDLRTTEEST